MQTIKYKYICMYVLMCVCDQCHVYYDYFQISHDF